MNRVAEIQHRNFLAFQLHIKQPTNFALNVPFLALLSDLDVLDIQLEIRQQNPTALVLHASAFSEFLIVSFHLSQDSSAFIIFIFSHPLGHCFADARKHTEDFHLRRKSIFEKNQRNCQTRCSLNFKEGNTTPVVPSVFAERFIGIINRIEQLGDCSACACGYVCV